MADLDDLDRRLLAALRADAREPVASLARRLGVTRATVNARMDRMVASGVIAGFSVRVREGQEPDTLRAIAFVEVRGRDTDDVIRTLRGVPGIQSMHTTNGGWDLVVELRTDSLASFDRLLATIRRTEGVVNSETSILLTSVLG
ncbi:Lrp/AsnC family transcriptional regulator [Cellulomonas sp. PhB143]|uniref:Lrp/AsnC family transcriptional regulator n=1 Tax=Cellulomonas sp. PhB143 TaxID=2485186 RepID=UPI000F473973|nr:Lrp/AsnC family transcriptional regulator [Cellulomonas sp. PhB143]ROS75382.1 DNA-binding Lrp family transcriptional regulator [Cellulomonas sp. PhB143]